ncbi:DUF4833 domain-containing protein [Runella sp.]|uniref:DUF4833 domain-containing protein n=1 Tax=Runella sp. TaxID=1960881 RepID=UPI0026124BD5|nr:DUF4833 domain-containing protein [Runella sp.]
MKIVSLLLLTGLLCAFRTNDTPHRTHFPEPPHTPNRLFYIQRSNDANTVMYEANLRSDKKLNPETPLNVYWIRYAERGQREDLSALQWQLAYGYKHRDLGTAANDVEINLNAFKKRPIFVENHEGKLMAFTQINGEKAALQKVFVQLASNGLIPKVHYIELFGFDYAQEKAVYERILIH